MDGKIGPIPLILILLVLFIALSICIPMVLLHATTQDKLKVLHDGQVYSNSKLQKISDLLLTPTATPTAAVEVTPTKRPVQVRPTVTPSSIVQ